MQLSKSLRDLRSEPETVDARIVSHVINPTSKEVGTVYVSKTDFRWRLLTGDGTFFVLGTDYATAAAATLLLGFEPQSSTPLVKALASDENLTAIYDGRPLSEWLIVGLYNETVPMEQEIHPAKPNSSMSQEQHALYSHAMFGAMTIEEAKHYLSQQSPLTALLVDLLLAEA